jgi:chromosome partitioning protein
MRTILVASSKGGAGKTTLATNLAAAFALDGKNTVLVDADRQRSSTHWCEKRAALDSAVLPVEGDRRGWEKRIPEDAQRVVIDVPAGWFGEELQAYLDFADAVIVPVQPSVIDLEATVPFLDSLVTHPRIRKGRLRVGLVANRLKPWTTGSQQALTLLRQWPYPLLAEIRDSQAYALLAGLGKSLFDYHSEQVRRHQEDWAPLLKWLKKG